jgi:hypothetical protein
MARGDYPLIFGHPMKPIVQYDNPDKVDPATLSLAFPGHALRRTAKVPLVYGVYSIVGLTMRRKTKFLSP